MDFKGHFTQLINFLMPYEKVWQEEVLNSFPLSLNAYPEKWFEELRSLSDDELWKYDCRDHSVLEENSSLYQLSQTIKELVKLPYFQGPDDLDLPSWAFFKVSAKKRHEISKIAGLIQDLSKENNIEKLIDIGGGVGHLARIMAYYFQVPTLSIDASSEFQETGKRKLTHHPSPEGAASVEFKNMLFKKSKETLSILKKNTFSLGLHTCGPLAIEQMKSFDQSNSKLMLNFGCCYNKLDPKNDLFLSQWAKEKALFSFNKYSLTLATRGHSEFDFEDYKLKKRVKYYRYGLHLLMHQEGVLCDFASVGSSHSRLYWMEFSDYVLSKVEENCFELNLSSKQINDYFYKKETQELVERMFLLNLVRWQFGRPLELLILLDRAIWLEERGYQVSLKQFFKEDLSPRNIGLTGQRF